MIQTKIQQIRFRSSAEAAATITSAKVKVMKN